MDLYLVKSEDGKDVLAIARLTEREAIALEDEFGVSTEAVPSASAPYSYLELAEDMREEREVR